MQMMPQQEQYRLLLENLPDGFAYQRLITDEAEKPVDYVFLDLNPAYESMMGITRDELIGRKASEVFPGLQESGFDWIFAFGEVALKGSSARFEQYFEPSGRWYEVTAYSDRPGYFITISRDITEQRNNLQALQESETLLRAVMDNLPIGIAINSVFPEVSFAYMNDNFARFYRVSKEALLQPGNFWEAIYEDAEFREQIKKRVLDDSASGDPARMCWEDIPISRKGQGTFYITAKNIPIPGKSLMISTVWDVTGSKRAEERLKTERDKLADLLNFQGEMLNTAAVWINTLDQEGSVNFWNEAAEQISGYRAGEVVGHTAIWEWLYPDPGYRGEVIKKVREILGRGEKVENYETQIETKSGERRVISWHSNSLLKSGKVVGSIAIGADITERKRAEKELRELNLELERRVAERTARLENINKELEAFAYSVSHDLRAPLRAIDGFSRLLQEDFAEQLDAEGKRLLGVVRLSARKMERLITDLLTLSRATRTELRSARVDMTAMARSVFLEIAAQEDQERFRFKLDNLPVACCDPTLIRQVWHNLLSNAIKFTVPEEAPCIEVGGYTAPGTCVYFVKDNGAGFDPDYSHKVFGTFQRLHNQEEFEGTGIGLAIVRRIVHRHGGVVWAEGQVDSGASFFFSLPQP